MSEGGDGMRINDDASFEHLAARDIVVGRNIDATSR
jgi:hypothetical protein